jgi:hypothetical protein
MLANRLHVLHFVVGLLLVGWSAEAFFFLHNFRHRDWRRCVQKLSTSSSSPSCLNAETSTTTKVPSGDNYSTLTLLEHMHLLNTNVHKQSTKALDADHSSSDSSEMIDFFIHTLGFGMDPKSISNLSKKEGVVFVNCGPSQLHLNDDAKYCQKLDELQKDEEFMSSLLETPFEIGLRYKDLEELKKQLSISNFDSYELTTLGGREAIRITDAYGRVFVAREIQDDSGASTDDETKISLCQQNVITKRDTDLYPANIVEHYGIQSNQSTRCCGMDYIEFFVHVTIEDAGATIEKIARFYDFFFDATTSVVNDGRSNIAIIGFGKIDDNGRAEQSLLFREVVVDDPKLYQVVNSDEVGTGHHIAIYVGCDDDDYKVAASNCVDGGLLWVNPQFDDRVLDVEAAMDAKQFRFKNIIDIDTGETLYVLEHEIRSISHPLFPGKS